jgi:hypothetical protein
LCQLFCTDLYGSTHVNTAMSYWIMACDVAAVSSGYDMLFGPAILQIGKLTPYFGGDVVPAALHIPSSEYYLKEHIVRVNVKYLLYEIVQRHICCEKIKSDARVITFGLQYL